MGDDNQDMVRSLARVALKRAPTRRIVVTYDRMTPESAAAGDFSESGWVDEEGWPCELDDMDRETGLTLEEKAVAFMQSEGYTDPSSSHFHLGLWYSTYWFDYDPSTGEEERRSCFLKGFREDEERKIFELMRDY